MQRDGGVKQGGGGDAVWLCDPLDPAALSRCEAAAQKEVLRVLQDNPIAFSLFLVQTYAEETM